MAAIKLANVENSGTKNILLPVRSLTHKSSVLILNAMGRDFSQIKSAISALCWSENSELLKSWNGR